MISKAAITKRLESYCSRETFVWLCLHSTKGVFFGWIIATKPNSFLFRNDERHGLFSISFDDVESVGSV